MGYTLKINVDETIAYSYTLENELVNNHCSVFVTGDDNTDELVLFNPESEITTFDLTFYDETGNQIDSITDQQLGGFSTTKIIINDYDDGNGFGWIELESDGDGIVSYFGLIGENYGLANSIKMTTEETLYSTFKSYVDNPYPTIFVINPTENPVDDEFTIFYKDAEESIYYNYCGVPIPPFSSKDIIFPDCYGFTFNPNPYRGVYGNPFGGLGDNPNYWVSPDSDHDGLSDAIEDKLFPPVLPISDIDGDGTPDGKKDPDTDDDDLPDGWEYYKLGGKAPIIDDGSTNTDYGPDGDPDADSLDNIDEYDEGTHPKWWDTDSDGLSDGNEVNNHQTDPLDGDPDEDDLNDYEEVITYDTDPWNPDSDDDTMPDGWEVYYGLNPLTNDANQDPDIDWLNNANEYIAHTSPIDPDYDGDGRPDGGEVYNNLNPLENDIKWTFLVYLDADNDLFNYGYLDKIEMCDVGSTDDITVALQWDGIYNTNYPNWQKTYRLVEFDGDGGYAEFELEDLGEKNMGDGSTFLNFLNWGLDTFPADKYAVILWNHGAGWTGYGIDETSNDDYLTLSEISNALSSCSTYIDLIGFSACLMGTPEVFYQIRNNAGIAVAHATSIYDNAWPFDTIISNLNNNPSWSASQFGKQIVTDFLSDTSEPEIVSACAVDLSKVDYLVKNPIDELAYYLKAAMEDPAYSSYYEDIFDSAITNPEEYDDDYDLRDLYYFADWLSNSNNVQQKDTEDEYAQNIREQASFLKTYLIDGTPSQKCIIKEGHGSSLSNSKGFNIYIPEDSDNWDDYKDYYATIKFSTVTNWDEMLNARY